MNWSDEHGLRSSLRAVISRAGIPKPPRLGLMPTRGIVTRCSWNGIEWRSSWNGNSKR
ncbi:MAG: hypothetical protein HC933_01365 [Pleurocapsa sp. SU_196_0]|nr:hypothetical protein [Pleurocapsa sp. SU_196_0]